MTTVKMGLKLCFEGQVFLGNKPGKALADIMNNVYKGSFV